MDTTIDTSTVLTVGQAAEMAGVSTKTIRRWLHSGRLEAGRAGEAYVITAAALKAAQDWTPSMDSAHVLSVAPGRVPSTSTLSTDLLDRLERQAERIGHLEAELAQVRAQLVALPAPAPAALASQGRPFLGPTDALPVEPTQTPATAPRRAPWWAPWRRAMS
jgi:excisionase family DNA binding protein